MPSPVEREGPLLRRAADGFLAWDYEHRSQEAVTRLAAWIRERTLRYREDVLDGESFAVSVSFAVREASLLHALS